MPWRSGATPGCSACAASMWRRTGAAHHYAEAAVKAAPALPWAGRAVLEDRAANGDWVGALAALDNMRRSGVIDKSGYRRKRAVLVTARALAEADNEGSAAKALAL